MAQERLVDKIKEACEVVPPMFKGIGKKAWKTMLSCIIPKLSSVKDGRAREWCDYSIWQIIFMNIVATISGSDDFVAREHFWKLAHPEEYKEIFNMKRFPSHDTLQRALGKVEVASFQKTVSDILEAAAKQLSKKLGIPTAALTQWAIDGKSQNSTGRKSSKHGELKNCGVLHIYNVYTGICKFSCEISTKSNEIPAAQKLLKGKNLRGVIITGDAIHTQEKTVNQITAAGGDYVLGLKGNQQNEEIKADQICTEPILLKIKEEGELLLASEDENERKKSRYRREEGKEKGGYAVREYYIIKLTEKQRTKKFGKWKGIKSLVCVERYFKHKNGEESREVWYYITSLTDPEEITNCVRSHWRIENGLHKGLDNDMHEDRSLTCTDPGVVVCQSIINKMCLTLLQWMQAILKGIGYRISLKDVIATVGGNFQNAMRLLLLAMNPSALRKYIEYPPPERANT